jgi:hypothetical protein
LCNRAAIAVISDTWRVERLFNNAPLLTCFIIHLYNHPQLYTFRLVVPVRLYKCILNFPEFWHSYVEIVAQEVIGMKVEMIETLPLLTIPLLGATPSEVLAQRNSCTYRDTPNTGDAGNCPPGSNGTPECS